MPKKKDGPKPTGTTAAVDLIGMLLPFYGENQPVLVKVIGSNIEYLPVFNNKQDLEIGMEQIDVAYGKIKQIEEDVMEFLQSLIELPFPIKLMVNPHYVNSKLRYLEIDPAVTVAIMRATAQYMKPN